MEYRIGELADEFGITLRTLRHYESRGLISPRRSGTTRHYSDADRERLCRALFAKRIGLPLSEIPDYLDLYENGGNGCGVRENLRKIYQLRLEKLQQVRKDVEDTMAELKDRLSSL